jgi:hypothetical protein
VSRDVDSRVLAARFHVTRAPVLAWARRGWIPRLRSFGRTALFDLSKVERALRERAERRNPSRLGGNDS